MEEKAVISLSTLLYSLHRLELLVEEFNGQDHRNLRMILTVRGKGSESKRHFRARIAYGPWRKKYKPLLIMNLNERHRMDP